MTEHDPIIMTISSANIHNPKDTCSQVDSAHGSKKRSSESGHETSVADSTKKKKKNEKCKTKSPGRTLKALN